MESIQQIYQQQWLNRVSICMTTKLYLCCESPGVEDEMLASRMNPFIDVCSLLQIHRTERQFLLLNGGRMWKQSRPSMHPMLSTMVESEPRDQILDVILRWSESTCWKAGAMGLLLAGSRFFVSPSSIAVRRISLCYSLPRKLLFKVKFLLVWWL